MNHRYGFVKVATATPLVRIGDCHSNVESIAALCNEAVERGVSIVVSPELSLTGYTCGDLFAQQRLLQGAEQALGELAAKNLPITVIVGMPIPYKNNLYNAAVVVSNGKICGAVPKSYIPNYSEFYESRWFASGRDIRSTSIRLCNQDVPFGTDLLFAIDNVTFGIEICEDLWVPAPPSSDMALSGALLLFNLSATPEIVGKHAYVRSLVEQQSARTLSGYIYCSAGVGESSTDLVLTGNGIIAENGTIIATKERFIRTPHLTVADIDIEYLQLERLRHTSFINLYERYDIVQLPAHISDSAIEREISPSPFAPKALNDGCREILNIQMAGLAQRLTHTSCKQVVLGISGGLDSTLALLVTVSTFDMLGLDRKGITAITMPGFGTTNRTYDNAMTLMQELGVTIREIPIKAACEQHFKDIGLASGDHGITFENGQARERTQILMDVANMVGGMVIGTGDLSEAALGWATYNGDHMSMYNVNCSIPKTLVKILVEWSAQNHPNKIVGNILHDIVDTPISPELLPTTADGNIAQKTEDAVGPYELHDFYIYHFIRNGFAPDKIAFLAKRAFGDCYTADEIRHWLKTFLRRFFAQQYKRSAAPDGPKVGSVSLSPRGDWRMPSDAVAAEWLREYE